MQYHESRVPAMTSDDATATPQREASSDGRKEECSTLARLREMGVSFVNKEDLIDNSKRFVNKTIKGGPTQQNVAANSIRYYIFIFEEPILYSISSMLSDNRFCHKCSNKERVRESIQLGNTKRKQNRIVSLNDPFQSFIDFIVFRRSFRLSNFRLAVKV